MRRTTTKSATDISTLSALTPQGSVASSKASWEILILPLFINCLYMFVLVQNDFFYHFTLSNIVLVLFTWFPGFTRGGRCLLFLNDAMF